MLLKKVLTAGLLVLLFSGASAWAATEVINYTYNDSLEVIRTDYGGNNVVDYTYDGVGNRLTRTISTSGIPANTAPSAPTIVNPANASVDVSALPTLSWAGSDPDGGDVVSFDIYLGTDPSPSLYIKGTTATSMTIEQRLLPMTTYYWKVAVRDNHNTVTEGPVWSFTTGNEAPTTPEAVMPLSTSPVDFSNVYLSWTSSDPDIGDSLTFDIYFGDTASPALVQSDSSSSTYTVGALTASTTYYWQITAKDSFGATTTGPVWSFQTTDHAPVVLGGNMTADTTLTAAGGPYLVTSLVTVDAGVTLTIEPGTIIKMQAGLSIVVNGTLDAQGTAGSPIIITSYKDDLYGGDTNGDGPASRPIPGDWQYIYLRNTTAAHQLAFTHILYGGNNVSWGAVRIDGGTTTIQSCTIADSKSYGIYVAGGNPQISDNEFIANRNYDIYAPSIFEGTLLGNTFASGLHIIEQDSFTLSGNTIYQNNALPVRLAAENMGEFISTSTWHDVTYRSYVEVIGGYIRSDASWPALMPYHIIGTITVQGTDGTDDITTLTIAPGAELRFNLNTYLTIGANSGNPGALSAIGTAAAPIVFTSNSSPQTAGSWRGIQFYNTTDDATTVLEHCTIQYAGYAATGRQVYIYNASPRLTNCIFRKSQGDGIYIQSGQPTIDSCQISQIGRYGINTASGTPNIMNNTFSDISNYAIYMSNVTDAQITGNTLNTGIYIGGGTTGVISGNTITYDDAHPLRAPANSVNELLSANTINNISVNSHMEVVGGAIGSDASWPALMSYHILGTITVQGTDGTDDITTLTIAPGAELRFNLNTYLTIGANSGNPGALSAIGTAAEPIVFTSNRTPQAAGDWRGIQFYNTADDATTVLEYCTIEYAGYGTSGRQVYIYNASPRLTNCTFRNSQGDGVYIQSGQPVIEGCDISLCARYGINTASGTPTITGNTFSNNSNYDIYMPNVTDALVTGNTVSSGIYIGGGTTDAITGNTINYNDAYPLRVPADDVNELLTTNTINNIGAGSYLEVVGGTIRRDANWPALMPYHILGTITVQGTNGADSITTLTIAPGAELRFNLNTYLTIGANSGNPGALSAIGTAVAPIVFTSNRTPQAAGDWRGIQIYNTADDATTALEYCTIEYAGYGTSGRQVYIYNASPRLTNCILRNSQGDGIYIQSGQPTIEGGDISLCARYGINAASGTPTIMNNVFSNNSNYDIYLSNVTGTVITGNTVNTGIYIGSGTAGAITGNAITYDDAHPIRVPADSVDELLTANTINNISAGSYLQVTGGTISRDATWPALMPYHILGTTAVRGTFGPDDITTLTIEPGAELRFNPSTYLDIGANSGDPGALSAIGTAVAPIVFTSNSTPQAAGDWRGIRIYNTADDATTVLEYCTIEYAGYGTSGRQVYIYGASPRITNCILRNSQGDGIYIQSGAPTIEGCDISQCARYGVNAASGTPAITGSTFSGNGSYDIYLGSVTDAIVTGNTVSTGIYVGSGTTGAISGNTINYDDAHPLRVPADDVEELLTANTFNNIGPGSHLEVIGGTISRDATWPALMPYHILGTITVRGTYGPDDITTLTIEPGAELRFNQNIYFDIGANSGDPGALSAVGTEAAPIVFTSNRTPQAAGDWRGIRIYNTADDATTVLEYCTIEYAGYGTSGRQVYIYSASPRLTSCTFRDSQGDGIYVQSGEPTIEDSDISLCARYGINVNSGTPTIADNVFSGNGNYDIYLGSVTDAVVTGNVINAGFYVSSGTTGAITGNTINYDDAHPLRVPANSVDELLTANTINNIGAGSHLEVISGTISRDATWPALMPYHILGTITVRGTYGPDDITTLSIDPGAVLRFNPYTYLNVGANSGDPGALTAIGTATEPIVFTSNRTPQAAGDWYGIQIYNTADDATTVLEYCTIEYAGYGTSGRQLYIYSASPRLTNCTFRYSQGDGIYVQSGEPTIEGCDISQCGRYGVNVNSGTPTIAGNSFSGNGDYDIYMGSVTEAVVTGNAIATGIYVNSGTTGAITGNTITYDDAHPLRVPADSVNELLTANTINNIGGGSYLQVISGTISRDATWPALMPYHILGTITVQGSDGVDNVTTLTIEPGAELRFNRYTYFNIGANSGDPGALSAIGTEAAPIVLTSNRTPQAAGDWYGINIYNTADDATTALEHCTVEYAGYGASGRQVYIYNASPRLTNCTFRYSQGDGFNIPSGEPTIEGCDISQCARYGINATGGTPTITDNTLSDIGGYDIYMTNVANAVITGNTTSSIYINNGTTSAISGNTINLDFSLPLRVAAIDVDELLTANTINNVSPGSYLEVTGGTMSRDATWPALMAYHIIGAITVQGVDGVDGITTLTIEPGAELRFNRYAYLFIGANSGNPGALVADGTADDPIVFTSNRSPQTAGDWYGVRFYTTSNNTASILDYCTIEYGGYGGYGNIYVYNADPTITNSSIVKSSNYGIYVYGGTPTISDNKIFSNATYGLYKRAAPTLIAENNWWGDPTGPYHPTSNPGGLGDTVSDNVDFDPWTTTSDDIDLDGMTDAWEMTHFGDLTTADDTTDYDNDGLLDREEFAYGTDPKLSDSDGDGMPDGWEVDEGLDPLFDDAWADADGDGFSNLREYLSGSNPWDYLDLPILLADVDGDGDVDGSDLDVIISQIGRTDCDTNGPCSCDLDLDDDVDDIDLKLFAEDYGRVSP